MNHLIIYFIIFYVYATARLNACADLNESFCAKMCLTDKFKEIINENLSITCECFSQDNLISISLFLLQIIKQP